MSKIPTTKEFLNKYDYPSMRFCKICMNFEQDLQKMLIEFAKLPVEAALKKASENVIVNNYHNEGGVKINKNSILNAYPLENIK